MIKKITLSTLEEYYHFFEKSLALLFPEYNKKEREFIFSHPKAWSKEKYKRLLKENSRILLGVWENDKVVGILDAELPFMGVSLADWLMVDKKSQKTGIGTKLLNEWERIVKRMGAHSIFLYADKRNNMYYKNRGFELSGVHKKAWFGQDHYLFTKTIQIPKEENYLK